MSGASEAAGRLKDKARAAYRITFEEGATFAQRHAALVKRDDLVEVLQASIDTLVALEALADAAAGAVTQLRRQIGETMMETGAYEILGTHHSASLSRKPAVLNIENPDALPNEYWETPTPEPRIVTSRVRAALKDGKTFPGVSLTRPNDMTLVVRNRKETVA